MFDPPVETLPVWVGLALASLAMFGLATSLPTAAPDATPLAGTVDGVAASAHEATGEHPIAADAVRLDTHRVTVRHDGESAHATLRYAPVTPVARGTALYRVLRGTPPARLFDSPAAFERAVRRARDRAPVTVEADRVVVRRVEWGGRDVTLVGG
jgi:hypothetical protein